MTRRPENRMFWIAFSTCSLAETFSTSAIPREKQYTPPQSIAIYLSKIDLPDLQPKSTPSAGPNGRNRPEDRPPASNGPHSTQGARLPPKSSTSRPPGLAPSGIPEQRRHSQTSSAPASSQPTESSNEKSASRIGRLFRSKS